MTSLPIPGADGLSELPEPAGTLHDDGCFVFKKRPHAASYAGWKQPFYTAEQVRDAIRAALAAVPAQHPDCKWPNCLSEKAQQDLADEIARETFGAPAQPAPKPVGEVGHVEVAMYKKLPAGTKLYTLTHGEAAQPAPIQAEPIYQWRRRDCDMWHDTTKEDAYSRIDQYYEARTVYEIPQPVESGNTPPFAAPAGQLESTLPVCAKCGVDRSKDRCKAEHWQSCPMVATALTAEQTRSGAVSAGCSPATVAGEARPDLASLQRYDPDWDREDMDVRRHKGEYVRFADVERLLNPTGETK